MDRLAGLHIADPVQRALARKFWESHHHVHLGCAGRPQFECAGSAERFIPERPQRARYVVFPGSPRRMRFCSEAGGHPWVGLFEDRMAFRTDCQETPPSMRFVNCSALAGESPAFQAEWRRYGYCRVAYMFTHSAIRRRGGRRMIRNTVMEDLAAAEFHDDEYIKDAKPSRNHGGEITGDDHLGVIANEGQPALGRILSGTMPAAQVLPHRARCHPNPELQFQFVGDPFFTPGDVSCCHRTDQLSEIFGQWRSSHGPGFPAPEQPESLAVPTDECLRLDDHEGVSPIKPVTQSGHDPSGGIIGSTGLDVAFLKQRRAVFWGRGFRPPGRAVIG